MTPRKLTILGSVQRTIKGRKAFGERHGKFIHGKYVNQAFSGNKKGRVTS